MKVMVCENLLDVARALAWIKEQGHKLKDIPVVMSSDAEGNSYGLGLTIGVEPGTVVEGTNKPAAIVYPHHEYSDIDFVEE